MPSDDNATTGGSLKLKGVQGSKIHKKKKRKKAKEGEIEKSVAVRERSEQAESSEKPHSETEADAADLVSVGKTEAEKRYEEVKRKRVGFVFSRRFSWLSVRRTTTERRYQDTQRKGRRAESVPVDPQRA